MASVRPVMSSAPNTTSSTNGPSTSAPSVPTTPTTRTIISSRLSPLRNSPSSPTAASRLTPGEQRRLHGLEHEQRDAGQQHGVGELRGQRLLGVGLHEQGHGDRAGVEQRGGEHRAEQQPAEVRRHLGPRRLRAGLGAQAAARVHPRETDERGEGDGEAVGADGRDADDGERDAERRCARRRRCPSRWRTRGSGPSPSRCRGRGGPARRPRSRR